MAQDFHIYDNFWIKTMIKVSCTNYDDLLIFYQTWSTMIIKTLSSHNVYQLINNISHQHHKPSHFIFTSSDCQANENYYYNTHILKTAKLYAIIWNVSLYINLKHDHNTIHKDCSKRIGTDLNLINKFSNDISVSTATQGIFLSSPLVSMYIVPVSPFPSSILNHVSGSAY